MVRYLVWVGLGRIRGRSARLGNQIGITAALIGVERAERYPPLPNRAGPPLPPPVPAAPLRAPPLPETVDWTTPCAALPCAG